MITKSVDFTPYPFQIKLELDPIQASGGGDGPECLTRALYDCSTNLKWRDDAIKIIIVITDAPPHGLEKRGNDGFPNGDPDTFGADDSMLISHQEHAVKGNEGDEGALGVDDTLGGDVDDQKEPEKASPKYLNVISIVQQIRDKLGATIYSVGCEAAARSDRRFGQTADSNEIFEREYGG